MRVLPPVIVGILVCALIAACSQTRETSDAVDAIRPPGVLIVNYAADWADTFPAPKIDSVLALDWLQMQTNARGLDVRTRQYPFGDLVIQIGPRRSGDHGDWLYEINGQMATEAVNKQWVARTDTLVFTFK